MLRIKSGPEKLACAWRDQNVWRRTEGRIHCAALDRHCEAIAENTRSRRLHRTPDLRLRARRVENRRIPVRMALQQGREKPARL